MKNYIYKLDFKVRDYECDLQGVVNNATYLNFLEHTRHEFFLEIGFDFAKLVQENIYAMVYNIDITYKASLVSGDEFVSALNISKEGVLKVIFTQDIYRKNDDKLMTRAKVTTIVTQNGKLISPDFYLKKISLP